MRGAAAIVGLAACALLAAIPAAAALRAATNGLLTAEVQDTGSDFGMFSIRTGADALRFRTLNPVGEYTQTFVAFIAPAFQAFEQVDDIAMPAFRTFGTVRGGPLAPTPPDRFGYVAWQDLFEAPWDTPIIGEEIDSATVYYWGFAAPLTLAPGASAIFTQYASTAAFAIGLANDAAAQVPALSGGVMAALAIVLLVLARRAMTRANG